jgi:hypothetical protein
MLLVAGLVAAVGVPLASAQNLPAAQSTPSTATAPPGSFDVASIHPNTADHTNRSQIYYPLGNSHFRTENTTVMEVVQWA